MGDRTRSRHANDIANGRGMTMSRFKDFFENFRATAARKRAAARVQREERNLLRRMRYWENKQSKGIHAYDPRRDVSEMNTNQLKAYARELNQIRGDKIKAAGISAPGGELLDIDRYEIYADLWERREEEKRAARQSLKLKDIPAPVKVAQLDINPMTGELEAEWGQGNFVLQSYGQVKIPMTKEILEKRIGQMQHWKSVNERIEISNANVAKKLAVIDSGLLDAWNKLNTAQKQHLISNENIFDFLNAFTFSTKDSEVREYIRQFPELASGQLGHLYELIENASTLERETETGA